MRRVASWLAISALALQALWPLIAQARPATLVPVCTVGGETHYVEIPGAPAPADKHCELCFVGAALPAANAVPAGDAPSFIAPQAAASLPETSSPLTADARAPPVLLLVLSDNDDRRNDETAFALRAARPDLGRGVVRFRILLG
jgi:hypothetical protein